MARGGRIGVDHLPASIDAATGTATVPELHSAVRTWTQLHLPDRALHGQLYQALLSHVEPPLFEAVLESTGGNRAAAADALGIHRATLRKKLHGNSDETSAEP